MARTSQQTLNPLDILARLSWNESDDLEFKSAKGGLPESLWETYSAMTLLALSSSDSWHSQEALRYASIRGQCV